jgi:PPM family protein phosphatase
MRWHEPSRMGVECSKPWTDRLQGARRNSMAQEDTLERLSERVDLRGSIEAWVARPVRRTATIEIPELHAAVGTTVGETRKENQDRAIIAQFTDPRASDRSFLSCLLCDGMGGMLDGGRCAEIAVGAFIDSLVASPHPISVDSTRNAVLEANDSIFRRYKGRGGTTLTALIFAARAGAWAITVGDTRLYEFSDSRKVRQLSTDDTIAGELKRLKGTESDLQLEPFSNRLAQFVGIGEGLEPRTHIIDPDAADSSYLLSTDGTRVIDEATFERLVSAAPSLQALALRLIHLSNWCGGQDNSSVICVAARATRNMLPTHELRDPLLEMWDCFAKLDVVILPSRPEEKPAFTQFPKPGAHRGNGPEAGRREGVVTQSGGNRTSRTKKHKKTEAKSEKTTPPGVADSRPPQKQLEIEIVESSLDRKPSLKTDGRGGTTGNPNSRDSDPSRDSSDHADPK